LWVLNLEREYIVTTGLIIWSVSVNTMLFKEPCLLLNEPY